MEGDAAARETGTLRAGSRFGGLRTRLVVLVLAAVLPAFVVLGRKAARDRQEILEGAAESARDHARVAAVQGSRILDAAVPYVDLLAQHPVVRGGDAAQRTALFRRLRGSDDRYLNIGLIARDGSVLASALDMEPGVNLAGRAYFRRAIESGRPSLGDYQIGKITKKPSINMGAPVRSADEGGEVAAVVFVAIGLEVFDRLRTEAHVPEDAVVAVVGPGGLVLACLPASGDFAGRSFPDAPLVRAIAADREGSGRLAGLDGRVLTFGWVPILHGGADTGGVIAVGISPDAAVARARTELAWNLATLGAAALLALVVAWVAGELLVVRRARRLVEVTGRIAGGDLAARVGATSGGGEIGAVARSVDAMAAALEERDAELRRAEARYRSLVEQTPAVFYVGETAEGERKPFGRTVHVGPEVRSLFGFDAAEWRTRSGFWAERLHPEDRDRVFAEVSRLVGAPGAFSSEYRLLDREGRAVWVRDAGTARREGDTVRITGFLVDVTEVKSLHAELLRTGQLDAAGRVAAGIARVVEEAAASAQRHARAVLPKVEEDAVSRGHVEGVLRALERLGAIVADLRAFGGTRPLHAQAVDVNVAIERLIPEIRNEAGSGVEVATLLARGVRPAWVDPAAFDEAVLRLAAHVARGLRDDRRRRGGKLTIGTLDVVLDAAAARRSGVVPGSFVLVAFGESGAPAAEDAAARAFEPFAEREPPGGPGSGSGTGSGAGSGAGRAGDPRLALASVFGFARQSGGAAEVAAEEGRGTTWRLLLPCPR